MSAKLMKIVRMCKCTHVRIMNRNGIFTIKSTNERCVNYYVSNNLHICISAHYFEYLLMISSITLFFCNCGR